MCVRACMCVRTRSLLLLMLLTALPSVAHGAPQVTTPLLKLYGELVYNKAQRLVFDSSSPNGILLFRDASAILVGYGTRIRDFAVPPGGDAYSLKYKGVSLCMLLLTRALSGNYVNFGACRHRAPLRHAEIVCGPRSWVHSAERATPRVLTRAWPSPLLLLVVVVTQASLRSTATARLPIASR